MWILLVAVALMFVMLLAQETLEQHIWRPLGEKLFNRAPISSRGCVSCGEPEVEWLEEAHYRCHQCGYEGGEGLKKLQDQQRLERIRQMSKEERLLSSADDLRSAEAYIDSALHHGASLLRWISADIVGLSDSRTPAGSEQEAEMSSFFSDLAHLEHALRDANDKLFDSGHGEIDFSSEIDHDQWQFDAWCDNLFSDLRRRSDVQGIVQYLKLIRPKVVDLRARLPHPDAS